MLIKSKAIVLRAVKFGDRQLVVDMLTEQLGRISFFENLSKTARGKIQKQYFQPLTMLGIELDYRQNAKLQHLKNVRLESPFQSIPFDSVKLAISLFLSEFICFSTRGEQKNELLYHFVDKSLSWLDGSTGPIANFHLVFMLRTTRFVGFFPNLENYQKGDFFDMLNGTFSHVRPVGSEYILPVEASKIADLMRMSYATMHLFKMSRQERNRCCELILKYYRLHVPGFPELKSFGVLKELFEE